MSDCVITRVWGVADGHDLSFRKNDGCGWTAAVPADLEDGQYATEIYAQDDKGMIAVWTGILYLNKGHVCLHLIREKYSFWFLPHMDIIPMKLTEYSIEIKGCDCR